MWRILGNNEKQSLRFDVQCPVTWRVRVVAGTRRRFPRPVGELARWERACRCSQSCTQPKQCAGTSCQTTQPSETILRCTINNPLEFGTHTQWKSCLQGIIRSSTRKSIHMPLSLLRSKQSRNFRLRCHFESVLRSRYWRYGPDSKCVWTLRVWAFQRIPNCGILVTFSHVFHVLELSDKKIKRTACDHVINFTVIFTCL